MQGNRRITVMVMGAIALVVGVFLQFQSGVSSADRQRCEEIVRERYASGNEADLKTLLDKCADPGMVAMMIASASGAGAQSTAQSVAAANRGDMLGGALGLFLMGFGGAVLLLAVISGLVRKGKLK